MPGTTRVRIGIDCRAVCFPSTDGVGTYTEGIVRALVSERKAGQAWTVFCRPEAAAVLQDWAGEDVRVVPLPGGRIPFFSSHAIDAWRMHRAAVDVLFVPGGMPPLFFMKPIVLVVHDLLIFDHPEWFPPQWFSRRIVTPLSLRRARRLVAVSAETQKTIVRRLPSAFGRTRVIPPGVPHGTPHAEGQGTHLLCLGTIEPRKNVPLLLRAYEQAVRAHPELPPLLLAGKRGWKDQPIWETLQAAAVRLPGRMHYLGVVDAHRKNELLRTASVLFFPSLGEGFGLPPLEAQAAGVPAVVSDILVLRETLGDGAFFVDPGDADAWAQAIIRISTDPNVRHQLIQSGKTNAARFSWQRTAEAVWQVCCEAGA